MRVLKELFQLIPLPDNLVCRVFTFVEKTKKPVTVPGVRDKILLQGEGQ
jgi:hypothetical protein